MIKVGITGGIGSGKSIVSKIFQIIGIPVFNADLEAKKIINEQESVKRQIIALFGSEAYKDQIYNTLHVAQMAFSQPELLKKLNQIVHPAVKLAFDKWTTTLEEGNTYCLKEAAIMTKAGPESGLDFVITVTADDKIRMERILQRDKHRTTEQINNIFQKQKTSKAYSEIADFEIDNNGENLLIPQVLKIHQQLIIS